MRTRIHLRLVSLCVLAALCLLGLCLFGCGSGNSTGIPDFNLAVNPKSAAVTQGGTATYTVTLTALNGFASTVTPSVQGLPAGATAVFAPSTLTPTASGATTTLTVTTVSPGLAATSTLTLSATSGAHQKQTAVALVVTGQGSTGTLTQRGAIRTAVDLTSKFVYVTNDQSHNISQFKINTDGTLSPLTPATVSVGIEPLYMLVNPAIGTHTLYVSAMDTTGTALYQFNINPDGTLSPLSPASVPATSSPAGLAADPAGKFLYEIDPTAGVRPFLIHTDGTLTQNGADFTDGGFAFFNAAVAPDGQTLYVGGPQGGGLRLEQIHPDGTLTNTGSVNETVNDMTLSPAASALYIDTGAGVDVYKIGANDALTEVGSGVAFMNGVHSAVPANGKNLYVIATLTPGNLVGQYAIHSDASLTPLNPAAVTAGNTILYVIVTPDGKFAYVINLDSTISQFRINTDGTLTPLSPATVPG